MFKNDFILDVAESLGKNIGKAITDEKDDNDIVVIENLSNKDDLLLILKEALLNKNYNEGENILFYFIKNNKNVDISNITQWFYEELSSRNDEDLIKNNFSRTKIQQGINDLEKIIAKNSL